MDKSACKVSIILFYLKMVFWKWKISGIYIYLKKIILLNKKLNMIKKIFFAMSIITLAACGPSQEDLDREQKTEDSLMEIERISILEKANQQLMSDTLPIDSIADDSLIQVQ